MKRTHYVTFLTMVACLVLMVAAWPAQALLAGSVHDFTDNFGEDATGTKVAITETGAGWNTQSSICQICHTPHNADTAVSEAPLWDHTVTADTGFDPYTSDTMEVNAPQPSGVSLLCLSCHDGTVALEDYGSAPLLFNTDTIGLVYDASKNFTKIISNDHPVSINYVTAEATDGELHDSTTKNWGAGPGKIEDEALFASKVECASCHDVHNNDVYDTSSAGQLLRLTPVGSVLCLNCHNK